MHVCVCLLVFLYLKGKQQMMLHRYIVFLIWDENVNVHFPLFFCLFLFVIAVVSKLVLFQMILW